MPVGLVIVGAVFFFTEVWKQNLLDGKSLHKSTLTNAFYFFNCASIDLFKQLLIIPAIMFGFYNTEFPCSRGVILVIVRFLVGIALIFFVIRDG